MPGAWSFYISVRLSARLRHLIWWGRRFRLPGPWHARLPQKIASFSSAGRLRVPDLAPLEDAAAESGFRGAPHRWSCLRGSRPRHGPVRCRSAVAPEPLHRESGGCSYSDRTGRETLLRALCVGGDAQPCSSAHPSPGSHCGTDALAEGIDLAERQPNPGADRAAVLAGRVFRSLPARFEADRANRRIYRGQPGFSRLGALGGMLAVVQRGLAGETACPTKPPRRSNQNVAAARALAGPENLELPCLESRATSRGCSTANQQLTGQKLEVHGEKLQTSASADAWARYQPRFRSAK